MWFIFINFLGFILFDVFIVYGKDFVELGFVGRLLWVYGGVIESKIYWVFVFFDISVC